jgi:hypothetical protein
MSELAQYIGYAFLIIGGPALAIQARCKRLAEREEPMSNLNPQTCPTCGGTGYRTVETSAVTQGNCPTCHGTGEAPEAPKQHVGNLLGVDIVSDPKAQDAPYLRDPLASDPTPELPVEPKHADRCRYGKMDDPAEPTTCMCWCHAATPDVTQPQTATHLPNCAAVLEAAEANRGDAVKGKDTGYYTADTFIALCDCGVRLRGIEPSTRMADSTAAPVVGFQPKNPACTCIQYPHVSDPKCPVHATQAQAQPQESELRCNYCGRTFPSSVQHGCTLSGMRPDLRAEIQALLAAEYTRGQSEAYKDVIAWASLGTMTKELIKEMAERRLKEKVNGN